MKKATELKIRELLKRGNGLFGSAEMTGSIGVVTINMARLGFLFKGNQEALFIQLDKLMELSKATLEKKRIFIQDRFDSGLYPYTKRYLPHFRNHFSTIGVNGMNEMVRNFTNDEEDITTAFGYNFCMEILDHIRNRMKEFQEETGNLYNLEATPAEGTTYRFAKEDLKRFPSILQAGMDENIYYTNSSQIPVDYTQDPFEALLMQDELQCKYTGGTVLHLYMNERISSPEACKNFVKTVLTKFKLPYITVTPVFSVCPIHGYLNGEHEYCPKCDNEIIENQHKNQYENRN
jgi:ribonucleoside-triphosphate reductase